MPPQTAAPLNIRRPLVGPGAIPANGTATSSHEIDVWEQHQQTSSDQAVVPVDAATTVSEAAHSAAQMAAQIVRPALVPRNDDKRANTALQ